MDKQTDIWMNRPGQMRNLVGSFHKHKLCSQKRSTAKHFVIIYRENADFFKILYSRQVARWKDGQTDIKVNILKDTLKIISYCCIYNSPPILSHRYKRNWTLSKLSQISPIFTFARRKAEKRKKYTIHLSGVERGKLWIILSINY